jgi:hypothetical protein
MKVGAIREGASAREFASEMGLGESDGIAASHLAARRALAASPDVLVPSASAFNRIVEQLEAITAGAGKRWSKRIVDASRDGMTSTAAWLRSLGIPDLETVPSGSAAQTSSQIEPPGQTSGVAQAYAMAPAIGGSGLAEPSELTFDDDWTEEDESDLLAGDTVSDDLGLVDEDDGDESDGAADSADDEIELKDDEEVEDEDDEDGDDDGPLLTDEAIDDLLADDSVDLDDDWMDDKPAS